MIHIPLVPCSLSQIVHFGISPLFEQAASLHILAQDTPPQHFQSWTEEVHTLFGQHLMKADWEYFSPALRCGIPDLFDPFQTADVRSDEEQYAYFLTLPAKRFANSLQTLLQTCPTPNDDLPLLRDLEEDPEYVKGRFLLFLSTYRQTCFAAAWEHALSALHQEEEKIRDALQEQSTFLGYLQKIAPAFVYQESAGQLAWNSPGPVQSAQSLLLCPSYYYASPPVLAKKGARARLLFRVT
jgi:hypothetical protein